MTYLLIIFLYIEGHVIEAQMDSLVECEYYEELAHKKFDNIVTQCMKTGRPVKIDPRQ